MAEIALAGFVWQELGNSNPNKASVDQPKKYREKEKAFSIQAKPPVSRGMFYFRLMLHFGLLNPSAMENQQKIRAVAVACGTEDVPVALLY